MTRATQQATAGDADSGAPGHRHPPRLKDIALKVLRKSRPHPLSDGPATTNAAVGASANSQPTRDGTHETSGAGGQPGDEGGHCPPEGLSTKPIPAVNSDQPRYTSSDVDYETKYAPDPYGEELSSKARVWRVYNDEAQMADKERAGLFSAVVTTFVAQSSQALNPDYAQITASLVYELVLLQRAINSGSSGEVPPSPLSLDSRTHQTSDVWINALWLISLMFSLLTALVSVLAKQWIQASRAHFDSLVPGSPRDRAFVRQYRFLGFERWRVPAIIGSLPVLLTIALFFFFAGLSVYTAPMATALYGVVISLSGISVVAYAASVTLSIIYPQCAYWTPVSDYIMAIPRACSRLGLMLCVSLISTMGLSHNRILWRWFIYPYLHRYSLGIACTTRESSQVKLRRNFLMVNVLEWLAASSYNNSAISISAQAISALHISCPRFSKRMPGVTRTTCNSLHEASLRDCGSSITQVIPLAGRIERLMRNVWLAPYSYSETTCEWLNERWDSLHNCRDNNVVPLRMHIYIAGLQEYRQNMRSGSTALRRALCAVDSKTWPSDLLLHPNTWRQL
ncbi:hypothetical protein EV715DRAFT_210766, partial [Schizophyllum commune]